MNERLQQQLAFALEIDKEKNILRQTHLSEHGRRENDAEHAWHMAIMSWLLREYANEEVDIARVMLMCLIHDVVEIDAGDTYAYDAEGCVFHAFGLLFLRMWRMVRGDNGNRAVANCLNQSLPVLFFTQWRCHFGV